MAAHQSATTQATLDDYTTATEAGDLREGDQISLRTDSGTGEFQGFVESVDEEANTATARNYAGTRTKSLTFRDNGRVKPSGTCFTYICTIDDREEQEEDEEQPTLPCNRCGGEAEHVETREVNGWINEASAYESYKYECTECGATGSTDEKGGAVGCVAPPSEGEEVGA